MVSSGVVTSLRVGWPHCGYLYIVNNDDRRDGKFKLGETDNIRKRLSSYNSHNKDTVYCIHLLVCLNAVKAEEMLKSKVFELGYCYKDDSREWVDMCRTGNVADHGADHGGTDKDAIDVGFARLVELMHSFLVLNKTLTRDCGFNVYDAAENPMIVPPSATTETTTTGLNIVATFDPPIKLSNLVSSIMQPTFRPSIATLNPPDTVVPVGTGKKDGDDTDDEVSTEIIKPHKGLKFIVPRSTESITGLTAGDEKSFFEFQPPKDQLPPRDNKRCAFKAPFGVVPLKVKRNVSSSTEVSATTGVVLGANGLESLVKKTSRKINRTRIPTKFKSPMPGVVYASVVNSWQGTNSAGKRRKFAIRKHGDKEALEMAVAWTMGTDVASITSDIRLVVDNSIDTFIDTSDSVDSIESLDVIDD